MMIVQMLKKGLEKKDETIQRESCTSLNTQIGNAE